MRKNILVFGGGELQLSIIQKIREKGYFATVIDPLHDAYARNASNFFEVIDGQDFDGTCQIIEKYKIDAILTAATDKPLKIMAKIAANYNFKFFSENTALLATDKYLIKEIFNQNQIPHAQGKLVNGESLWHKFPCIIKPRDNSGSRGVIYCNNHQEYLNALAEAFRYTAMDTVLVEEFISGKEYSIESLHYNGKAEVLQITEKQTTEFPYNVELGHIQPCDLPESQINDIKSIISSIGIAAGFENCASHTEIKIEDNRIVVIETSPRLGGDFITSHLVPLSTGIDMEECLIDISLGNLPIYSANKKLASAIEYFHLMPGIVKEIKAFETNPDIVKIECSLKPGSTIPLIRNSTDRYGYFIISGNNRTDIIEKIKITRNRISDSILLDPQC
jgi:biotin carboxylase